MRTSLTAGLLVGAALLAGCGGGADPRDPGVTPLSESLPDCSQVWVDGKTLPGDYAGCVDDKGVLQAAATKDCTSTEGTFTTYADRFFALKGQVIHEGGPDSQAYQQAYGVCFGTNW